MIANLPGDAARELLGQVVRKPGSLDAQITALEFGDVWCQSGTRSDQAAKVDCGREKRGKMAMISKPRELIGQETVLHTFVLAKSLRDRGAVSGQTAIHNQDGQRQAFEGNRAPPM